MSALPVIGTVLILLAAGSCLSIAAASDDNRGLEDAIQRVRAGDTVIIEPGTYHVANLELPPDVILHAPEGATIVGNLIVRGPGTVIRGFTLDGGMIDISRSHAVTIGDCLFKGGETAIKLDEASGALIVNNEFRAVAGGVITGWGLDRSTISGNHFYDCGQCINLAFNNDRERGRGIAIERNIFKGVARMPVEVGPIGAYTENLVVRDNWAEEFRNRGPDPGETMSTFVAYSLVPTHGVNTVITGNYAIAGSRGRGDIGIELAGSGTITGNHIEDFRFGAIVYGTDFRVRDNLFLRTTDAAVLNYANLPGEISLNGESSRITHPPERRAWPCRASEGGAEHFHLPDWPCD